MDAVIRFFREGFEGQSFMATIAVYIFNGVLSVALALGLYYTTGKTQFLWVLPFLYLLIVLLEYSLLASKKNFLSLFGILLCTLALATVAGAGAIPIVLSLVLLSLSYLLVTNRLGLR